MKKGKEKKQTEQPLRKRCRGWFSLTELFITARWKRTVPVMAGLLILEGASLITLYADENLYPENVFQGQNVGWGTLILAFFLYDAVKSTKSNVDYTLRRLKEKPEAVFVAEIASIFSVLFIYWGCEY